MCLAAAASAVFFMMLEASPCVYGPADSSTLSKIANLEYSVYTYSGGLPSKLGQAYPYTAVGLRRDKHSNGRCTLGRAACALRIGDETIAEAAGHPLLLMRRPDREHPPDLSRRRDCHSAAPPSPFSRRFNKDEEGVSSKCQSRRRLPGPPHLRGPSAAVG